MNGPELTLVNAVSEHAAIDRAIYSLQQDSERASDHWSVEKTRSVQREALLQRSAQLAQIIRGYAPTRRLEVRLRAAFLIKSAIHRRDGLQRVQQILDEAIILEATLVDASVDQGAKG